MIEKDINMNGKSKKTVIVCDIFINPPVFNLNFGDGAAGAASNYGSGSTKMMRLLAAPALQHCKNYNHYERIVFLMLLSSVAEQHHFGGARAVTQCSSDSSSKYST
jgi:hypothetical protein